MTALPSTLMSQKRRRSDESQERGAWLGYAEITEI